MYFESKSKVSSWLLELCYDNTEALFEVAQ